MKLIPKAAVTNPNMFVQVSTTNTYLFYIIQTLVQFPLPLMHLLYFVYAVEGGPSKTFDVQPNSTFTTIVPIEVVSRKANRLDVVLNLKAAIASSYHFYVIFYFIILSLFHFILFESLDTQLYAQMDQHQQMSNWQKLFR